VNSYIAPYKQAKTWGHEERRRRKLLASKRELSRMWNATQRQGMTLMPLVMYFNHKGLREAEDRHREGQEGRRQARDLGQARLEPAKTTALKQN
jgi:SsrA-binding protein